MIYSTSTIAIAVRTLEIVNEEMCCAVRSREIDGEAAVWTTAKSTSKLLMTAPMVHQDAPCEKDSLMNAVADDGAAAARDNFRSVVALAEGAAIDARCAEGCGRPSASRTKPCTEQSVSRSVAHGVRRHPDFGAWTGGITV